MTTGDSPTPTLDDAHEVLIEALAALVDNERITQTGHTVDDVYDGGADRHHRIVTFSLVMEDGTRKTFAATIKEDEDPEDD